MIAKRLFMYVMPYKKLIGISIFFSIAVSATDGVMAYLVQPVLDDIFISQNGTLLQLLPFGVIALFFLKGVFRYIQGVTIRIAGQLAMQTIRNEVYSHMVRLPVRHYSKNSVGSQMSKVINDVSTMQVAIADTVTVLLKDSLTAIALLGLAFYQNWQLTLLAIIVLPLTILPVRTIGRKIKKFTIQSQEKIGELSDTLQETFSGIKIVKSFALSHTMINRFATINDRYYRYIVKTIKNEQLASPVIELISSFGIAAIIWFGGKQVIDGSMTTGEFFSFLTALGLMLAPVKRLIALNSVLQRSFGAAERVFEVLDTPHEITDPTEPKKIEHINGNVIFHNVSFRYDDEWVLRDINLEANSGDVIALVGMSGGGKTTLASLLVRFYDVTEGAITIDGVNIKDFTHVDLANAIAFVDQETILFNDTVRQNILYGKPDATEEQVIVALKAANAYDFVMAMEQGLDSVIGDRGVRLSGGQRQRLCIARAIVKNAPILILDEATSALDNESEALVQAALHNLMQGRTTFIVAHRLSTITHADKIVVLEQGRIAEAGNHAELLKHNGHYARYYTMQFTTTAHKENP
ncbi:ABC transporter ATP-binding protein [Chrysiogenes arsenatis]|uniref:ABC transporter ATP-binding protein n=1 Tax=Chrysiogenes arsenatis TaxID=309797 RepID=UPI0004253037|nr:ABC transporter transmembrane domain-containing protein [Chrysiogenes arsenatis]